MARNAATKSNAGGVRAVERAIEILEAFLEKQAVDERA